MAESPDAQPRPDQRRRDSERTAPQWYGLAGVGVEFIVAILVVGGVGWWLDVKLGTTPWLMIAGTLLGFAAGLWLLLKAAFRAFRNERRP